MEKAKKKAKCNLLGLLLDFGSGTLELRIKTNGSLANGEWHRIDIFWDTEVISEQSEQVKSCNGVGVSSQ